MISLSSSGHVTSTGTKFLTRLNGSFETSYCAMTRSMRTIACFSERLCVSRRSISRS
jgi:hypothetical protein